MLLQRAPLPELFSALCTRIRFLTRVHPLMSVQVAPTDQFYFFYTCIFTSFFYFVGGICYRQVKFSTAYGTGNDFETNSCIKVNGILKFNCLNHVTNK
jgi:hypothetical protein